MRKFLIVAVACVSMVSAPVGAVSEEVLGAVSMNCNSILGQIQNVKYYDRRAREYLGNRYERLIGGYVTNMNVRLVRNNITNVGLQEIQKELAVAHSGFKSEYSRYATELDELAGMNCTTHPEDFYTKLGQVRDRRTKVRGWVQRVNEGLVEYRDGIEELRGQL